MVLTRPRSAPPARKIVESSISAVQEQIVRQKMRDGVLPDTKPSSLLIPRPVIPPPDWTTLTLDASLLEKKFMELSQDRQFCKLVDTVRIPPRDGSFQEHL